MSYPTDKWNRPIHQVAQVKAAIGHCRAQLGTSMEYLNGTEWRSYKYQWSTESSFSHMNGPVQIIKLPRTGAHFKLINNRFRNPKTPVQMRYSSCCVRVSVVTQSKK